MNHCIVCKQNTHSAKRFPLTCRLCRSVYHHRCHKPPVSDQELLSMIGAAEDPEKGLGGWRCDTCSRHRAPKSPEVIEISEDEEEMSPQQPHSASSPHKRQPEIISLDVSDDSDGEVVEVDPKLARLAAAIARLPLKNDPFQPRSPVAVFRSRCPPPSYLPPPWAQHSPPDQAPDIWDNARLSKIRSSTSTSSPTSHSRKTPKRPVLPASEIPFAFDATLWKANRR
ncbi:hypothetical protein CC2G_009101 [Coprinopsis cinerea AmutBmut pab1-1]|nr:hypothetical protein CC2G_009101 [Coprinopsis cinerea AmutBmut pab1-1]